MKRLVRIFVAALGRALFLRVLVIGEPTMGQLFEIETFHRRWWNVVETNVVGKAPADLELSWWVEPRLPPPLSPNGRAFALDPDGYIWTYDQKHKRWFFKRPTAPLAGRSVDVGAVIERTALFNREDPDQLRLIAILGQLYYHIGQLTT